MSGSRRLIFKGEGGETLLTGFSVEYFWDLVQMIRADPEKQTSYELRFESYKEDVAVSYVEDPIAECAYAVVSGNDMDQTCSRIEEKAECWTMDEMLRAWDEAEHDTARILAILRIGVGAPYAYDERVAAKLGEALADDDRAVREAALAAMGYRDWCELDAKLERVARDDTDERCRNRASAMLEIRKDKPRRR